MRAPEAIANRQWQLIRQLLPRLGRRGPRQAPDGPGRVLWRLDRQRRSGQWTVLVQSQKQPDWDQLLVDLPPHYLADDVPDGLPNPDTKERDPCFAPRQRLLFRLRANPTVKRDGRRHGLFREEDQIAWLARKGELGGFMLQSVRVVPGGTLRGKLRTEAPLAFFSVLFEGILEATDPEKLRVTLAEGIGSAKGFGFGLLSLARAAQ